ncbi:hypothetical protein GQ43DRAFT_278552 [Delitschia confertaspora ATCC 74209]|uniref:Uncharacterized protein n=1 Tax=Delitschia confertaspora ATCC 74209 TaxID=1513339 RepID=A0A9P4N0U7_9PLEO|nr:hypothetical protein GQ43DRAFT_278552 [Delitschia confertaspora ATCC 74209]
MVPDGWCGDRIDKSDRRIIWVVHSVVGFVRTIKRGRKIKVIFLSYYILGLKITFLL